MFLFISAFVLNFIWENLHFPLYTSNSIGINNYLLLMLYASFIDAFWIIAVYVLISIIDKDYDWKLEKVNIILFSILLFAISFFIEKNALSTGRWVYSSFMPVIFGIGISPLFQLVITGWVSLFIIKKIFLFLRFSFRYLMFLFNFY